MPELVRIEGDKELERTFRDLAPREAKNLSRRLVVKIAAMVRNDIQKSAKSVVRKRTGNLFKAIRSKRDKGDEKNGDFQASVIVNLKPSQGAIAPHWHFIEFGTIKQAPRPFIRPVIEIWIAKLPRIYREEYGRQLERTLAKRVSS